MFESMDLEQLVKVDFDTDMVLRGTSLVYHLFFNGEGVGSFSLREHIGHGRCILHGGEWVLDRGSWSGNYDKWMCLSG